MKYLQNYASRRQCKKINFESQKYCVVELTNFSNIEK